MDFFFIYFDVFNVGYSVLFDFLLVRGLDYYIGVIYEVVIEGLVFKVFVVFVDVLVEKFKKKKGKVGEDEDCFDDLIVGIGFVVVGGRYDNFVGMFFGKI